MGIYYKIKSSIDNYININDIFKSSIDNISLPYDKNYISVKIKGNFQGKFQNFFCKIINSLLYQLNNQNY